MTTCKSEVILTEHVQRNYKQKLVKPKQQKNLGIFILRDLQQNQIHLNKVVDDRNDMHRANHEEDSLCISNMGTKSNMAAHSVYSLTINNQG